MGLILPSSGHFRYAYIEYSLQFVDPSFKQLPKLPVVGLVARHVAFAAAVLHAYDVRGAFPLAKGLEACTALA